MCLDIEIYLYDSLEREKPFNQYKNDTVFHGGEWRVSFPEPLCRGKK